MFSGSEYNAQYLQIGLMFGFFWDSFKLSLQQANERGLGFDYLSFVLALPN